MFIIDKDNLNDLFRKWSKESEVYAPQVEEGQVMLLPYEEEKFTMDYVNFAFPVKEHLFKQREILFNWGNKNGSISIETPINIDTNKSKRIFFGVRPCEVHGIKYTDKFFLKGYRDEFYARARNSALIAAVNCTEPGENCFCSSMGTGPFASSGYDLLFTPLKDAYLVEIGTEKGRELIHCVKELFTEIKEELLHEKEIVEKSSKNKFKTKINTDNISKVLEESFNSPIWKGLSKDCITCTGCTSLCPTCTCFNVVEESIGDNCGCRVRYWDSCQSDSFTRNAQKHNPRSSEARVRYRIYDKFKYIEDKFNMKGCNGCGRCINVCPAAINVVEIINKLSDSKSALESNGGE
ncbi:anaerobic sulfite reductase subunit A [Clostridium homopropionicum DSM 5847]|uniref:Anaerobic sulfite reductase subunit A n=1 Tax=Clostridium homopropionicum DSM 5847 TaxID=1121318 RepID=A0A0L6ZCJ9_9CLOT|nr:4Fe-4S dicluster domain-containing protein [Clostridium homopropionicum]KOA20686.1 anaerobic sulfite reductase subunit A [Clostridium homopropionicum DSM 5847]SFF91487.1 4Fe-4S dicluster domain-containing protein [Clostridium homopropionicum]